MNRREFIVILFGAIAGGGVWLETYRRRRELERRREAILQLVRDDAERAFAKMGEELMLPIRDLVHYERWARPFYGLPRQKEAWEVYVEKMAEYCGSRA